jgi:hypothetical protein
MPLAPVRRGFAHMVILANPTFRIELPTTTSLLVRSGKQAKCEQNKSICILFATTVRVLQHPLLCTSEYRCLPTEKTQLLYYFFHTSLQHYGGQHNRRSFHCDRECEQEQSNNKTTGMSGVMVRKKVKRISFVDCGKG